MLVDVVEPVAGQRLHTGAGHRFETHVHRVRAQHRRDRQPEIGDAGVVSGGMGERLGETGHPRRDFEDQLGQVDLGDHPLDPTAQIDQRRRVGNRFERDQVQLAVLVDGRRAVPVQA